MESFGSCTGCGWQPDNLSYSVSSGKFRIENDTAYYLYAKNIKHTYWSVMQDDSVMNRKSEYFNFIISNDSICSVLLYLKFQNKCIVCNPFWEFKFCPNTKYGDLKQNFENLKLEFKNENH
jgi:hypothetical protein